MQLNSIIVKSLFFTFVMFSVGHAQAARHSQTDSIDRKTSYALGYQMALDSKGELQGLNVDAFNAGYKAAYLDKTSPYSESEVYDIVTDYYKKVEAKSRRELERQAFKNKNLADKFLAENRIKSEVNTTASGLQYSVLRKGDGKSPQLNNNVTINYEGKLLNGEVFDSTYDRGEPATFPVDGMIEGFTESLLLMKEGGKYELFIPPELGYGEDGNVGIEPNSVLIFNVELISVE